MTKPFSEQDHPAQDHPAQGLPLAAIVGQDQAKLALELLAIDPGIGGLLLTGEKGTAKSTMVRAATRGLFTGRMVTVPLNATEDHLVGGMDLDAALGSGTLRSKGGLLAQADGGVVYVDEINLLADHLVDVLLDATATGVIRVHRDGVDRVDGSRFALVGSMNPEEGALRPQLLDRFGLSVEMTHLTEVAQRCLVMERQRAYDANPAEVIQAFAQAEHAARTRVVQARRRLPTVRVDPAMIRFIADLCANANVAGHRADVILTRAAKAHAARDGRWRVTDSDCSAVAELVLAHRRRTPTAQAPTHDHSPPAPDQPQGDQQTEGDSQRSSSTADPGEPSQPSPSGPATGPAPEQPAPSAPFTRDEDGDGVREEGGQSEFTPEDTPGHADELPERTDPIGEPYAVQPITVARDRLTRRQVGRRFQSRTQSARGRKIRAVPTAEVTHLSLIDTVRAAAIQQHARVASGHHNPALAITINPDDWRRAVRVAKAGSCVLFVVDASGSMGAKGRMLASKGAVQSLLLDAYARRDQVGLIAFRRNRAELLLPFTHAIERATRALATLPTGGRTPLGAGLLRAQTVLDAALVKDPTLRPLVVLVTDGRATIDPDGNTGPGMRTRTLAIAKAVATDPRVTWVVVDSTAKGAVQASRARELADALGGQCFAFSTLKRDDLLSVTSSQLNQLER